MKRRLIKASVSVLTAVLAASLLGPEPFSWHDLVGRFERAVGDVVAEVTTERPAPRTGLFVPAAADRADEMPGAWIPLEEIDHPPSRLVVLVHGLDEPGDIWKQLAPAIVAAGHDVARFEYPNDEPVHPSAALLLGQLASAREAGVEEVAIVAHSMGGLVAFDALTRPDGYGGEIGGGDALPRVTRLITIGTPWAGSPWNRLTAVSELREQVVRWSAGASWDLRPLVRGRGDVTGRAGEDLGEGSELVTALAARPTPAGLPLTVIAGRIVAPDPADWSWVTESLVLREVLGADAVAAMVADIESIGGVLGDGVVPIASALARATPDTLVFEANHRGLIRETPIDFVTESGPASGPARPPAIDAILDRLAGDRAPGGLPE